MPNFIAKELLKTQIPSQIDGVEFLSVASSDTDEFLYHCKFQGCEFLLLAKKSGDKFVIKSDKTTRLANLSIIQRVLEVFKNNFTKDVISTAFAYNNKKNTTDKFQPESIVLDRINSAKKIFVEIGFGSGRHLIYQAKNNPDTLVVGIEIYKPSIIQVSKLGKSLDNLLITNTDARVFLSLIKSNQIDKIFLHFPVPWEDAQHRRIISDDFVKTTKRILKLNGKFELRTDDEGYFEFAKEKFGDKNLEIFINKDLEISSKYEDRWKKLNKNIYDLIFSKKQISDDLFENFSLKFDKCLNNLDTIYRNFKNFTLKEKDYFIHFERIYKINSDGILIKVSFGAFDYPQNCYIKLTDEDINYFIKRPIPTKINYLAHNKIKECLQLWNNQIPKHQ